MVVVFDSNVLIPLVLKSSRSTVILQRLRAAGHEVASSPAILDEVREKMLTSHGLRRWLNLADHEIDEFLKDLPTVCVVVPGLLSLRGVVPRDPDDDMVIAAAVESGADYIVTEDRDLLDIGDWHGIRIMSRADFAAELDRLQVP